jgi:hypothetical protein
VRKLLLISFWGKIYGKTLKKHTQMLKFSFTL